MNTQSWLELLDDDNTPTTLLESDIGKKQSLEELLSITNNIQELPNINILKNQYKLCEYLKNNYKTYDTSIKLQIIESLLFISRTLCLKNNQKLVKHKILNNTSIPRSSYKFCINTNKCINYYHKNTMCNSQHFVYNKVFADIDSLKYFISNNIESTDIIISINTLLYVIDHMVKELTF